MAPFHDFLIELIHQDPDITLRELTGALEHAHGVRASISGGRPGAHAAGLHVQEKSLIADERRRARAKRARADWFSHRMPAIRAMPERVVFIDEPKVRAAKPRSRRT